MIGYRISRRELQRLIELHSREWMGKARERTAGFRKNRKFSEKKSIWSEIKPVYMRLQGVSKCAFCERKLESERFGKGEQAVEHFRPKGNVSAWKLPAKLAKLGVSTTVAPKGRGGYYLLAYDIFNYSAACNPCNSSLKRDYFPVSGKHNLKGGRPETLLKEKPLIIYPIGDFDQDPETLIRFNGLSPYACATAKTDRDRALVTIEFFQLDSPNRSNLMRDRAQIIVGLYPALKASRREAEDSIVAEKIIAGSTAETAPHANCARSFCNLFLGRPDEAYRVYTLAAELVSSKS